ncbi:hypothetical protein T03_17339 [Trichinella britovi]|uniref:Uncharacterized protein n=1 Tax=Trichinella britovi TaxID=45882 RepID=A0A0V0ZB47_TRIBR|nr:hypothetical protein T03_17339 [Trichinella britovi]
MLGIGVCCVQTPLVAANANECLNCQGWTVIIDLTFSLNADRLR